MLELRPNCECCGAILSPSSAGAYICSFECTFCAQCGGGVLRGKCPNCGGQLLPRPARPEAMLLKHPASDKVIVRKEGCTATAP